MPEALPLTTQRLRIRVLGSKDADALQCVRSDPEVARYQSWEAFTRRDAEALIGAMRGQSLGAAGTWYQLVIARREDDALIGDLAWRFPVEAPSQAEIGFNLGRAAWGRGYGREAVSRFLPWLSEEHGVQRVFAITDERNHASRKLLKKCGFRPARGGWRLVFFKGEWAGEMVYERLAEPRALQSSPR